MSFITNFTSVPFYSIRNFNIFIFTYTIKLNSFTINFNSNLIATI